MPKDNFTRERDVKFTNNNSILFGEPDESELQLLAEQDAQMEAKLALRKARQLDSLVEQEARKEAMQNAKKVVAESVKFRAKVQRAAEMAFKYGCINIYGNVSEDLKNKFGKAVRNGKTKIVKTILKKFRYLPQFQAQLIAIDKDGCGPLHKASGLNHAGVVKEILRVVKGDKEQLAKQLAPTIIGTPWQIAVKGNCIAVTEVFLDFVEINKDFACLLFASRKPQQFLDDPANPLTLLITKGKLEFVTRILKLAKGNKELSELLFSSDSMSNTSLHIAAAWGHADIIKVLVEAGMDPHAQNDEGHTALFLINRKHAENGTCHSRYENRLREAEAAVEENRKELERLKQQQLSTSRAISFLEQAMASSAIPEQVQGSKVDASQVKLGQHPEVLFSLARC